MTAWAQTLPQAPSSLSGVARNGYVQLSWVASPSSGITAYTVKRGTVRGGPYTAVSPQPTSVVTTFNPDAPNGTPLYYVVTATNANGESANSNEVAATANNVLAPPLNVMAEAGNGQIILRWDLSAQAASYTIKRDTSATGTFSTSVATGVTQRTYTNTGLTNGTTYYYKVVTVTPNGTEAPSTVVSATPGTALAAPTNVQSNGLINAIQLNWDGAPQAVKYNVWRSTSSSGPFTTLYSTPTTNYFYDTATDVQSGSDFYYCISSVNSTGTESVKTTAVSGHALSSVIGPTSFTLSGKTSQVVLDWDDWSNAGATNTTYGVRRAVGAGAFTTLVSGLASSTYTDNSAVNGTTYKYVVYAQNLGGTADSDTLTVTPLAAPASVTVAKGPSSTNYMVVTATPVSGATAYRFFRFNAATSTYVSIKTQTSNTFTDDGTAQVGGNAIGISNFTTYYYRVTALSGVNSESNYAAGSGVSGPTGPAAPLNLNIAYSSHTATLTWDAPTPGPAATGYTVSVTKNGAPVGTPTNTTIRTFTLGSVIRDVTYVFTVTPYNAVGNGQSASKTFYLTPGSQVYNTFTKGDLFVGCNNGTIEWRGNDTVLKKTLMVDTTLNSTVPTYGMTFDNFGNLLAANGTNTVTSFSPDGGTKTTTSKTNPFGLASYSAYKVTNGDGNDFGENVYIGGNGNIRTYGETATTLPGPSSWLAISDGASYVAYASNNGTSSVVKRYLGLSGGNPLPEIVMPTGFTANAVAVLPGQGTLVASGPTIRQYNGSNVLVASYDITGVDGWSALTLGEDVSEDDPSGFTSYFYAAANGSHDVYKFYIGSGGTGSGSGSPAFSVTGGVTGLAMKGSQGVLGENRGPNFLYGQNSFAIEAPYGVPLSINVSSGGDLGDRQTLTSNMGTCANGVITFTPALPGFYEIVATVTDIDSGTSANGMFFVYAYNTDSPHNYSVTIDGERNKFIYATGNANLSTNIILPSGDGQVNVHVAYNGTSRDYAGRNDYFTANPTFPLFGGSGAVKSSTLTNGRSGIIYFRADTNNGAFDASVAALVIRPQGITHGIAVLDFVPQIASGTLTEVTDFNNIIMKEICDEGEDKVRSYLPRVSIRRASDGCYWSGATSNQWMDDETLLQTIPNYAPAGPLPKSYQARLRPADNPGGTNLQIGETYNIKIYGVSKFKPTLERSFLIQ